MNIGDCYILSSDFHKIDIGLVFIGETKSEQFFATLNFPNDRFDNTPSGIFDAKIQTSIVLSGHKLEEVTGLLAVHEYKKTPSFLKKYFIDNKPFINLKLNADKIILGQGSDSLNEIIISGYFNMPESKEIFDKFHIQSLCGRHFTNKYSDLTLILQSN